MYPAAVYTTVFCGISITTFRMVSGICVLRFQTLQFLVLDPTAEANLMCIKDALSKGVVAVEPTVSERPLPAGDRHPV